MELLGRFELPTSSLPILFQLFIAFVACCIMLLRRIEIQGFSKMPIDKLLYAIVCCRYGFCGVGMGFVWVSENGPYALPYHNEKGQGKNPDLSLLRLSGADACRAHEPQQSKYAGTYVLCSAG